MKEKILDAIRPVKDPELKYSIVDLGLIYDVITSEDGKAVTVHMTLTSVVCPMQKELKESVIAAVKKVPGIETVEVVFVFDPPWSGEKASEDIQDEFILRGIPLSRF